MQFSKTMLILIVVLSLCVVSAYADEIPTKVNITNTAPIVSAITFTDTDGDTIQPSDVNNLTCYGTVTDADGFADVTSVNASFFGPSSTVGSAPSTGTKYENSSCTLSGGAGITVSYACNVLIHHHAEPGVWRCNVTASDSTPSIGTNQTSQTVDTLRAIAVPLATLDFGAKAHGANSGTTDYTVTVNNTGNVAFSTQIDAYSTTGVPNTANAMICSTGTLPVTSLSYNMTAAQPIASRTALANVPTNVGSLSPTAFGATAYTQQSMYFGISIPASGQSGSCAGFLDVIAI